MYIKRLEIQGFKSFANRTVLDFLPPKNGRFSVTGVVGPNGSGKSNVTDAIRWVMGEQSMKTIRSKKSEDVIFSGSAAKGAMSAAEVTMILDNADDRAEIGTEEITITRRLYRSGESEYLVNNNPTRLIDIHLLIAKSGVAEGSYSIVSQGMIDKLLTVSPAERKDFFDEASGIKEFQIKRHQADLKLIRTEENIKQADAVMQEVEPRLKMLSRQVRKLEERHEVETELRGAQEKYYVTLYNRTKSETDELNTSLQTIEIQYRQVFDELNIIQNELAELSRSATRQEVFDELQAKHQEAVRAKNALEKQLAILEGQMHTEYSQAGKHNIGWLESKVGELRQNHEKLSEQLEVLSSESSKIEEVLKERRKELEELQVTRTQSTLKISRLQNQLLHDQSEQNYLQFTGLTAVKAVMDSRQRFGTVHGLVAELGEVAEEYRTALEVTAGQHLSSLVVEDESVARKAIDYLRENKFGVATFLPLSKIQARDLRPEERDILNHPDVIDLALNLIRFDDRFYQIFSFIFGSTLVVKDLLAAERVGIGRARMVTLTGDIAEKQGVMRGGFRQKKQGLSFSSKLVMVGEDRLEQYRSEIDAEQNKVNELDKEIEQLKGEIVSMQVEKEGYANKLEFLMTQKTDSEAEKGRLERELGMIQSSPEEYGEQLKKLSGEKESLISQMSEVDTQITQASSEIESFNRKEEEKKQKVFTLQETMQKKQSEVNTLLNQRNDIKIQVAKLDTKQEDLAQEVFNDMNVALASILERVTEGVSPEELENLAQEIQKLKYKLSLIGGIDEEVTKEYETTKERYDFLSSQLNDLNTACTDLRKMIGELDELMKKKRSAAFKKIRKEFSRYFQILFEGGNADLEEVYGDPEEENAITDGVVETHSNASLQAEESGEEKKISKKDKILTGIEVIANPPGKKIKYLNALSGGERTLTSIALICAILHDNPSPFVILDEVEAALDEANTQRFVRIMSELSTQSQFIIITHNRVTMHATDALYGVVMNGDGISQLLSVKMEDVPQYEDQTQSVDK
jgi:chromosome segregation protein